MKFLNVENIDNIKKDRIFQIAKKAIDAKKQGYNVYNATLGTLYDETLNLVMHKTVYEVYDALDNRQKASYAPGVDGGVLFADAVLNWVFQKHEFLKVSRVVATPGGSGALSTVLQKCVKPNETIIIPDIFWSPYELMASARNIHTLKCNCFDNGEFSLNPIYRAIESLLKVQNNVVVIMNDPAHNPTGYSIGLKAWNEFIDFCNRHATHEKTITIVNDVAYIDYTNNFETSRDYMECFKQINDNIQVVFAFSGSKTFTAYGMRIGAAIIYSNNKQDRDITHDVFESVARATWSNVNHGAINMVIDIFNNEAFIAELKQASQMLSKRTEVFIQKCNEVGLKYYPFTEGFFVTIEGIDDNEKLFEALQTKHIYVVPMNKGIRIAVCALPLEQCKQLPALIKQTIKEIQDAN